MIKQENQIETCQGWWRWWWWWWSRRDNVEFSFVKALHVYLF